MNLVDIVILILFVPAIIRGVSKGFVQQAMALAALVLSIWAAFRFYQPLVAWLRPYIGVEDAVLKVIAFALILIAVIVVTNLIARLLARILRFALLGWLDKLLGIVFALGIALVLIGLLAVAMHTLNHRFQLVNSPVFAESVLYNALLDAAYSLFPSLKHFLHEATPAAETITAAL